MGCANQSAPSRSLSCDIPAMYVAKMSHSAIRGEREKSDPLYS